MVKFFVTICLMLLLGITPAMAMPEIMTTEQIKPGMQGYAETMVQGNQKVRFNVEIMGVVNNGGGSYKQILARAYGDLIDDTNGVIHGMSGSPVYVDGKLIGAVARSVGQDVLPYKFYITPVEEMMKIWQMPDPLSTINKSGVKPVGVLTLEEYEKQRETYDEDVDKEVEKYKSKILSTPEGETREKGKAQKRLEEILSDFEVKDGEAEKLQDDLAQNTDTENPDETATEDEAVKDDAEEAAETADDGSEKETAQAEVIVEENEPEPESDTEVSETEAAVKGDEADKEDKDKEEKDKAASAETDTANSEKIIAALQNAGMKEKANEDISISKFILDSIAKQREMNKNSYSAPADVYVSGFTGSSFNFLKEAMAGDNMVPYQGSVFVGDGVGTSGSDIKTDAVLHEGDAVGVVMAYGDFFAGGTGTVTAVNGDKILAFGHPMTYKGNVNYFLTEADVIGTAGGILNGVKVSSFGKIIGRVNQDRFSGVSGILHQYPASVPIRVFVKDKNLGREEEYAAKIAYDEDIIPALAASIVYASMERTADRSGYGTANVNFSIKTDEVPEGVFERENMFYDAKDVGQFVVGELTQAVYFLCTNMDKPSNIFDIRVDVDYTSNRNTASIVSAIPDKEKVKPGETVVFKVMIKPYRKEAETVEIPYVVPKTQKEGTMAFEVKGGGFVQLAEVLQSGLVINPQEAGQMSTADRLNDLKNLNKNNEIVITPTVDIQSEQDQSKAIADAVKLSEKLSKMSKKEREELNKNRETKVATKYVIDNFVQTSIEVEKD
ncbi:SpoIVB peptidase S55 domain-containing protein [Megamonas hypermegale]|uniref:SpoIVB peptidase S55 domain-containing protein n=1 Tax=Megamonas hypermegale TaxID=158847 RepID=UPI0026E9D54F|nr:SpoIVB peptidase S55 domain-containing protein [Megamonas hypermegale]